METDGGRVCLSDVSDASPLSLSLVSLSLSHSSLCQVSQQVRTRLQTRAKDFYMMIDDVSLTHLSFSPLFTESVEAKQVAQQEVSAPVTQPPHMCCLYVMRMYPRASPNIHTPNHLSLSLSLSLSHARAVTEARCVGGWDEVGYNVSGCGRVEKAVSLSLQVSRVRV